MELFKITVNHDKRDQKDEYLVDGEFARPVKWLFWFFLGVIVYQLTKPFWN